MFVRIRQFVNFATSGNCRILCRIKLPGSFFISVGFGFMRGFRKRLKLGVPQSGTLGADLPAGRQGSKHIFSLEESDAGSHESKAGAR